MSPKHILLVPALALLMYLGMYSWNQRTHILDNFAANTGLEASGVVLKSVRMVQDTVMGAWNRYLDLVDVREENDELKKQVEQLRHKLLMASEERCRTRPLAPPAHAYAAGRLADARGPRARRAHGGEFRAGVRAHRARVHDGGHSGDAGHDPAGRRRPCAAGRGRVRPRCSCW